MSINFTIGEDGACFLAGQLVHPGAAPLAAARAELASLLKGAEPQDLLVLAGGGLGWHARAALDSPHPPQVVVYEPDPQRRSLMACMGPVLTGAEIVGDDDVLAELLGRRLVYGQPGRVALFAPAAYRQAAPEVVRAAQDILERTRSRAHVNAVTCSSHGEAWLERLAANMKQILHVPDASLLAGVMEGVPALVVGAGPSLDQSLGDIAAVADKCLIFAAASALGPLTSMGVRPHLALALEARDESRQFAGADQARTILAAALSGHPNHFSQWSGPQALFHLQPWTSALTGMGQFLPTGGHATSAAFSLALLWGCDPVILVGQDLAYTQDRIHASARPGGEEEDLPEFTQTPAIDGGMAKTSHVMLSYITWYQEAAAFLRMRHPGRRVVNATAAGAFLPGWEHRPLGQALPNSEPLSISFDELAGAMARLPLPRSSQVAQGLAQARAEVRRAQLTLAAGGLAQALQAAPQGSAAADVLSRAQGDQGQARAGLERLHHHLGAMAEGLHA